VFEKDLLNAALAAKVTRVVKGGAGL